MSDTKYLTEVPSSLKQLARLVVRGFYTIEDALIIDMLVRNPCMKEDDLCELLRFERKQTRARIATLRSDKLIQTRLKLEIGPDAKAQKINYYFINYKTFVNVVKYKLDLMRKRMETEERDATSRASFKCSRCTKTFTDLEADQLFDFRTQEFCCTYCGSLVEEDSLSLPKKDSRLMLARFNEQMQPLYDLLRQVENVTLAPELLEPEPVDIEAIRGAARTKMQRFGETQQWSGEATRTQGFVVEQTRIDINIHDEEQTTGIAQERKARPIWMTQSTVVFTDDQAETRGDLNSNACCTMNGGNAGLALHNASRNGQTLNGVNGVNGHRKDEKEDIMLVLMQNESRNADDKHDALIKSMLAAQANLDFGDHDNSSNSSDSSDAEDCVEVMPIMDASHEVEIETEETQAEPIVYVRGQSFALDQIDDELVVQMTPQEKENYIIVYQNHYIDMFD